DRALQTFERKKDADAFHATVKVDVAKGEHVAPSRSETVKEAAERWIERVKANGMRGDGPAERSTIDQYRQHIDLHIVPRLGLIRVSHLTTAKLEAFRDDLLASMSRAMARKVLTSTKSILKVAKRAHVAADASIGGQKRKRKLEVGVDIPTPDEIRRLLHAPVSAARAALRPRTLLLVAIFTGLRASELRGLRWCDVDLKKGEVHVRQRADKYNAIGAPKSVAGVRTVDIGPRVVAVLREWKLACPKGEGVLVFPSASGEVEHH